MQLTTESIALRSYEYSSPRSRYYRLQAREDKVVGEDRPWEFVDSEKRISSQTNRAFAEDGPATALFAILLIPYFYTLHGKQLSIPKKYRHARYIRNKEALRVWREALQKYFVGAFLYKFEVGLESDEIHVHLVADMYAGLLELSRDYSEGCKPVTDAKKLIRYLEKPPCYPIKKRVREYARALAKAEGSKLPKVSGYIGLPPKAERFVSEVKSSIAVSDMKN